MFTIKIAERLRPFSHLPGVTCLLPGTEIACEVFPTLLRMQEEGSIQEIPISLEAPCIDFTVVQNIEERALIIFGKTKKGDFRYRMNGNQNLVASSRLSLGSSKQLDWELVNRRKNLKEILPLWYALGQLLPQTRTVDCEGSILGHCMKTVEEGRKEEVVPIFLDLFLAGFKGIMTPTTENVGMRGFELPVLPDGIPPAYLLAEGAKWIKRIFLDVRGGDIHILPVLPREFDAGRMLNVSAGEGTIDLEWRSRKIRRMICRGWDQLPHLVLPKGISHFRVTNVGTTHYLDRFI